MGFFFRKVDKGGDSYGNIVPGIVLQPMEYIYAYAGYQQEGDGQV